ncbi:MAG TPA: aldo/keto reductase [Nocardioides sp.]|uniref:aldo/keto reductase n=1 Tax=uncultured Nocardioides sp. TaxID=198441 RepID=UPI0026175FDF|nr:aldo/keto reductase [uncultured Nocardioides sp.]HRI94031.1 aldo/keto reductase [Nocardioides sp.]HRK44061.1 aldo/keto reductase [Nocardioides sp.]
MQLSEIAPGIVVSNLCIGGGPLSGWPEVYGYDVNEAQGVATVEAVFASPINFLDTSHEYGGGRGEQRVGAAIKSGKMPDGFVVATKADSDGADYSGRRVRESFELSLERLGLDHIDLYHLHDPEKLPFEEMVASGGAVKEIIRLKEEGLVSAIGVAGGHVGELGRYVDTGSFDVVLNYAQYTLLNRHAEQLIDKCVERGVAFINAAPYASGILSAGNNREAKFQYGPPDHEVVAATEQLRDVCASYGVDIRAVALQFSTRDPRIASTAVGISRPERVRALLDDAGAMIPEELWDSLPTPLNREITLPPEWEENRRRRDAQGG